ncbi:dihydropteroate synthase [Desulfosudis oleivorans]|uniref:Dihydropteroate synthase n=1 Tax=Desulfosudis oleivorans (strain DSM 6200 / JCM 39069 / Hxd3) TaxID=96561 RepID=A8ZZH6_DESOH|nr:dihydropteroate synthase [Desulfosudis oleivorans]ABW68848.1 dihydropteroate synthase [Desulfosudis oleivorans Hxd3]
MSLFTLSWGDHRLELGRRTLVMGILNVTPDSFSDGGRFATFDRAVTHARRMAAEGADILDIGGESTRPFSDPVTEEEEKQRVLPVIERLVKEIDIPISIDTNKASVARAALDAGASIINDVSALTFDSAMAGLAADAGVPVILMHMQGNPKTMQQAPAYEDVTREVMAFLKAAADRAGAAGVDRAKIIVDPGIGFGKNLDHNLTLIKNLSAFESLGLPLLIGTSRKAFIRKTLTGPDGQPAPVDAPAVRLGTQATVTAAVLGGAHIVRVHDVADAVITVKLADAIKNAPDK